LGSLLLTAIEQAAMTRADMPEADRRDHFLYLDEFQSFTTPSTAIMLSESRKYRLCLTLSHQLTRQLDPETYHAVIGNCGTILSRSESTRLNSSHVAISYAVFCLKKKKNNKPH